ncbi:tetratricopeptide repeat protein [Desulfosudis oleivorans]|uniref:protein O-GlcNAc transferase n=1 Tax=Desulfosudis oleivorans (strain DSM 6200 / JCM 39069 / Hxd3) TaxID=96561 RepID=A8ZX38_DESOH|nr:tetratricopeptide repeat protein [Desulfosudis oleivorans]ABW66894.1 Tetratricopeptide TPR_2 repeat protein [Desulfosudis oleivorans Hxd3]
MKKDKSLTLFNKAVALHRAGSLEGAETLYRDLLRENPNHADALHLLGTIMAAKKDLVAAEGTLRKAVEKAPKQAAFHNSLGQVLLKKGQTDEAAAAFQRAVSLDPGLAQAHFNLGKISKAAGRADEAKTFFEKTLNLAPHHLAARNNLGNLLQQAGDNDGALACFEAVLKINPRQAEAHYNIGNIHKLREEVEPAARYYEQAIACNPGFVPPYIGLARIHLANRRNDLAESLIRKALRMDPKNGEALSELANLYLREGRIEEAVPVFLAAIRVSPEKAELHGALATAYSIRGATSQAMASFEKALELDPDSARTRFSYGNLLESSGNREGALEAYRRVMALDPDFATQVFYYQFQLEIKLGMWEHYEKKVAELVRRTEDYLALEKPPYDLSPLILNYFPVPGHMHKAVATRKAKLIDDNMASARAAFAFVHPKNAFGRLRIGYLSPDFREHAVGIVINDIFKHHDTENFEIFAYSLVDVDDDTSRKLKTECEHFVDVSKVSPRKAAAIIYNDHPHILIDLAGYTTFSRPEVLALRPAPIQASAIGYPNTMGAGFIDYILADRWLIPEEMQDAYTERVVRLPHAFPSSAFAISDKPMTRSDAGLPEAGFVFCCFNAVYKMEPETFGAWMEILREADNAVLWLSAASDAIRQRLTDRAVAHGVDAGRLVFAEKLPHPEYMARYQLADLFLDTFLYTAGSTAVCALHGGVPVLTRTGPTNASRMGASICAAAGMEETICPDTEAYIQRAVHLARHPEEAAALKEKLAANQKTAPLFDPAAYTRGVEAACRKMWERYESGQSPEAMTITNSG